MIEYGNLLICILLTYYTVFIFNLLFNKKYRNEIKHDNEKMSELRKIPIKSIEQQKEFLKYRHPINKKTSYLKFIGMIVLYLGLINLYKYYPYLWKKLKKYDQESVKGFKPNFSFFEFEKSINL